MNFKNIPEKYRPVPFWSWNDKLDTEETKNQVKMMKVAGIGGFFMHARGGLQTEYMSDEWFENVEAASDEAKRNSMYAWAYDENGWPSGFGDGMVNGLGINYQQKYLRISSEKPQENIIGKTGEHWAYYEINPFYVDTLDKNVIRQFIESSYEPYYERFKNDLTGFFTDEPQISRDGVPWSFVMADEYKTRYNRELLDDIEALFFPVGDYKNARIRFWKMVTDLFSEAYFKQIYDWCNARNLKFTGHLVLEDSMAFQLASNGACMPHYEYFHIPGMDWLGRNINNCLVHIQVSSVKAQLGKEQALSETFALCGHNVSFSELKGIYEWQMVHGINLLCQHLEGYSIKGMRKRDYPPAMYYQQPWWCEYRKFTDAMSRESMILTLSKETVEVLLIHPQTTAWTLFDGKDYSEVDRLDAEFLAVITLLEQKHIPYHLGDETVMERHATVENGKIVIGTQQYSCVLNPCGEYLLDNTQKLLSEFIKSGGKISDVNDLPANDVTDNKNITYLKRTLDNTDIHYFVNTSPEPTKANINVNGKQLDIYSGEFVKFSKEYEFEPWGSLMVFEDKSETPLLKETETPVKIVDDLVITHKLDNMLTLDKCDYYFDGELQEKNGYVLNICERANKLEKAVHIHQDYRLNAEKLTGKAALVCETPEMFIIFINGKEIEKSITDSVIDKSFKKIDITDYLQCGENTISFDFIFKQSDKVYENIKKAMKFESEKNKLVYDMEIEPIYIIGDFGVKTNGVWNKLDRNAVRYIGDFSLCEQPRVIKAENIEQQGFPFFCGEMTVKTKINIQGNNPVLVFNRKGVNVVKVKINGTEKVLLTENKISLKDFEVFGETEAELTLINNLRNLLGPHHLKKGEAYSVGPSSFVKDNCVWNNNNPKQDWDDDYCFVEFGI